MRRMIAFGFAVFLFAGSGPAQVQPLCEDPLATRYPNSICRSLSAGGYECQTDSWGERFCAAKAGTDGQTLCETCIL